MDHRLEVGVSATYCQNVFIPEINQETALLALYWRIEKKNNVQLGLNDGKLEAKLRNGISWSSSPGYPWSNPWKCPENDEKRYESSDLAYELGWNLIWYITSTSNITFISYPHFQNTPKTSTIVTNFNYAETYLVIGDAVTNVSGKDIEFQGIIHSVRIISTIYSETEIRSSFLRPTGTPNVLWDYFTSMFPDLSTQNTTNHFKNYMRGHNGNSIEFKNSHSSNLDSSNGLKISSGETQVFSVSLRFYIIWYKNFMDIFLFFIKQFRFNFYSEEIRKYFKMIDPILLVKTKY